LLLGIIAYNLGNLLRRLVLPFTIQSWSLTSLQQRLFKTGARLIRHARYFILQLAQSYLTGPLFRQIVAPSSGSRGTRRDRADGPPVWSTPGDAGGSVSKAGRQRREARGTCAINGIDITSYRAMTADVQAVVDVKNARLSARVSATGLAMSQSGVVMLYFLQVAPAIFFPRDVIGVVVVTVTETGEKKYAQKVGKCSGSRPSACWRRLPPGNEPATDAKDRR